MYNDDDYDDKNNDLIFLGNNHPWSDAFLAEGWVGDFYNDEDNENDNDGDNDEDDHLRFLFPKVLPMQSTAMTTVRTTTMT